MPELWGWRNCPTMYVQRGKYIWPGRKTLTSHFSFRKSRSTHAAVCSFYGSPSLVWLVGPGCKSGMSTICLPRSMSLELNNPSHSLMELGEKRGQEAAGNRTRRACPHPGREPTQFDGGHTTPDFCSSCCPVWSQLHVSWNRLDFFEFFSQYLFLYLHFFCLN